MQMAWHMPEIFGKPWVHDCSIMMQVGGPIHFTRPVLSLAMRGLSEDLLDFELGKIKYLASGLYAPWRGAYCYALFLFYLVSFEEHPSEGRDY